MATEEDFATQATAETWRWWGPINRPWAPDPVRDSLGRPEQNLAWWWRGFWRLNPRSRPKGIDDAAG